MAWEVGELGGSGAGMEELLIGEEVAGEWEDINDEAEGGGKVGGFPLSDIPLTWSCDGKPTIALGGGRDVDEMCLIGGLVSCAEGIGVWYGGCCSLTLVGSGGGREDGELEDGACGDG
jgi:hypothetical protein